MGDMDGMFNALQAARQLANEVSPQYSAHVAAWEARGAIALGDVAAASRWMQESGLSANDEFEFRYVSTYVILARVLIAQGQQGSGRPLDETLKLLARLLTMTDSAGAVGKVIEVLVLQAIALQARGKMDQALTSLEDALSLAEPEGYVRIFIDEGPLMAHLLRQAAAQGIVLDYGRQLLAALESEMREERQVTELVEPLSERELEVLRLLTTHLSSTQIAQELFISANTVRSHIKSIYGKLNVHSRKDAVQQARKLNLL
jgi:LuxR family maltose regulon positive regulatory protein